MKLTKVRLSQVRQFRGVLEIEGFDPGLNVFWGPNEAGKSTVVRAIRAAFLERYRSSVIEDLLPRGETSSTSSPTIEVQFTTGGQKHTLVKSFFHRKRCTYTVGSEAYDGEDAEDAMATMLGFGFALKGASKASNWGIPGLLWIQQGDGHNLVEPVGNARNYLRIALESTVSAVASSAGDDLLAKVRAERGLLLTPETGKPRGVFAEVIQKLTTVDAEVVVLDGQIEAYRADVDRLALLKAQHAGDEATRPWEDFQKSLDTAKASLAESQRLQARLKELLDQKATLSTTAQVLAEQMLSYVALREGATQRVADLAAGRAAHEAAQTVAASWDARRSQAARDVEAAGGAVAAAESAERRLTLTQQIEAAQVEQARLADVIEQAQRHSEAMTRHHADAKANAVSDADAKSLTRHSEKLRDLEISQRAAATAITFALEPQVTALLDGQRIAASGEHRITSSAMIEIDGVGRIGVVPGEGDAANLARQMRDAQDELGKVLRRIGVVTVGDAQVRQERQRLAAAEAETAKRLLAATAPQGLEALQSALATAAASASAGIEQLQALSPASQGVALGLTQARAEYSTALAVQKEANAQHSEAALQLGSALARMQTAESELSKVRAVLADAQTERRELQTQGDLAQARMRLDQTGSAITQLEVEIEKSQPDVLRLDVKRLQAAMEGALSVFQQRAVQISNMEGGLEQSGANGLEDRRADLQAQKNALTRRRDELKLRAEALQLLVERMEDKRRALTRKLQAPLQARLDHYLRLLFPSARLELNEDLTPGELLRGAGADAADFPQLSYGAQEQLALVSRLAYADLLREAGKPTLIILDDALVHSDKERLEQMQRILFNAAERHQVLLFTCHRERWSGLGAPARELRSFVTSVAPVISALRATSPKIITAADL
jgi:chromosome segregation ATPase